MKLNALIVAALAATPAVSLYGAQPVNESLTPASVTFTAPATTTFTFTASDTDGPTDLMGINAIFGDASGQFQFHYQCWFWYDRAANTISVNRNDVWTAAPIGSGGTTLQGQACNVDTAAATVATSGNNLSLSVPVTLGGNSAHSQPIYMRSASNSGADTNYQQMGTWTSNGTGNTFFTISAAPSRVFLAPGVSKTFQITVTDAPGYNETVNLSLGNFANGARVTGTLNPTSITGSGAATLTLTADNAAPPHSAGVSVTARSSTDSSIEQSVNALYSLSTAAPSVQLNNPNISGSDATVNIGAVDNSKSVEAMPGLNVLINSALDGQHACWTWYDRETNYIWLANDDATSWSGIPVGGSSTVQNSQCTVYGPGSTFSTNSTNHPLGLGIHIVMAPTFSGTKNIYIRVPNNSGFDTGYQQKGTWIVP